VNLGGYYQTPDGQIVKSITLAPATGIVLVKFPLSSQRLLSPGNNVQVSMTVSLPSGGIATVHVNFDQITEGGVLTITATDSPLAGPPYGYQFLGVYYDVTFTGNFSGYIYVTFPYDDSLIPIGKETQLKLFHWEEGRWRDVTYSLDTVNNRITGRVTSLSPFAIGFPWGPWVGYSTGVNTHMIALIAGLAISVGLFILRRFRLAKA
jgi:hypothetical protein